MSLKIPIIIATALCCHPLAQAASQESPQELLTTDTCGIYSYSYQTGTSLACPHVAGIAALILERNPYLTVTQVNDIIEKSTVKVGDMPYNENRKNGSWNSHYGYGMVNAYKAVMNTPRPNILIKP